MVKRWAIIRKHQANLNSGAAGNPANSQLNEAQLATRRAVSHALNMSMMDNLLAACLGVRLSIPSNLAAVPSGLEDTSAGSQTQQLLHHKGTSNTPSNFRKDLHTSAQLSVPSSSSTVPSGSARPTYTGPSPSIPRSGSIQQDYNSSTRSPLVTCFLPLNTTSSTLPTLQMMSGSSASAATLCGSDKVKKTSAISTVDTGLLSKEVNSEEKNHAQLDFPKLAALAENQTTVVEKLRQTHNVDAGENKPLLVVGKESENSNIIKEVACSTTVDEY